jgi:hypothetical protein
MTNSTSNARPKIFLIELSPFLLNVDLDVLDLVRQYNQLGLNDNLPPFFPSSGAFAPVGLFELGL